MYFLLFLRSSTSLSTWNLPNNSWEPSYLYSWSTKLLVASGGIQLVRDWLMNHLRSKLQESTYYTEEGTGVCGIMLAKETLWKKTCEPYSPIELCPLLMGVVGLVRKKAPRSFSTLILNSGYFCNIEEVVNYVIFFLYVL